MIENIKIKNFKSFKKAGKIDIGKINVFVGPNSSGKSSFIQGLLLLKNVIECAVEKHYKALEGDYKSLVYNKDAQNKLQYTMSFDDSEIYNDTLDEFKIRNNFLNIEEEDIERIKDIYKTISLKDMCVTLKIVEDSMISSDELELNSFELTTNRNAKVEIFFEDNKYSIKLNNKKIENIGIFNACNFYFKIEKINLKDIIDDIKEEVFLSFSILEKLENTLIEFSNKLIYMTSVRTDFLRSENIGKDKKTARVGSRGQYTLSALMDIDRCCDKDCNYKYKKAKIGYWLDEFDLGDKIEIKEVRNNEYSIMIRNKYLDIYNNILDVGIGTSQLLPLIIESVNSDDNSFIIVEEPETHIHPKAQAKLSDLFVSCAQNDNKKFLIETHSIFLITELQILVASKKIDANDVKVYFFDQDREGTKIKNMVLAENGQFEEEWPSGFFDIHYELGKKLFELM